MLQNDDVKGGFKGRTQTKSPDLEGAVCWVPLMHAPFQSPSQVRQPCVSFIKRLRTTDSNALSTAASVLHSILLSVILAAGMGDICERMLFTEETHVRHVNKCMLCFWDLWSKCISVQHCSLMHSILEENTYFLKKKNQWIVVGFYSFNSQSPCRKDKWEDVYVFLCFFQHFHHE